MSRPEWRDIGRGPIVVTPLLVGFRGMRRRRRSTGRPTVAEIVARVEAERAVREVNWPRIDLDAGVIGDDRPTRILHRVDDPNG